MCKSVCIKLCAIIFILIHKLSDGIFTRLYFQGRCVIFGQHYESLRDQLIAFLDIFIYKQFPCISLLKKKKKKSSMHQIINNYDPGLAIKISSVPD